MEKAAGSGAFQRSFAADLRVTGYVRHADAALLTVAVSQAVAKVSLRVHGTPGQWLRGLVSSGWARVIRYDAVIHMRQVRTVLFYGISTRVMPRVDARFTSRATRLAAYASLSVYA